MLFALSAAVLTLAGWVAVRGRREAQRLHLTRVEVPVPHLPEALDGIEIIHLSDLHLTGYGPYEQDLLRALRPLPARVVVITGDFLGGPGGAQALIPLLMEIGRDRIMLGVLGNHDYRPPVNTAALARDLARAGVRLLVNDAAVVVERGHRLRFVGVDDPHTGRADVEKAMAALPPPLGDQPEPVVVLAHSPDVFPDAERAGAESDPCRPHPRRPSLSARRFPSADQHPPRRQTVCPRSGGRRRARLCSSLAASGPAPYALRLFCPPEIAVVRLVAAPAAAASPADVP